MSPKFVSPRFPKSNHSESTTYQKEYSKPKPSNIFNPYKVAPVKQFSVNNSEPLSYQVGDTVNHMKFGQGVVTAITEGGRDYEVTVDFSRVGIKKMLASFAKLQKIKG